MMALTEKIAADTAGDGATKPWCAGIESGGATGWPATDWIEDFVLRVAGPDAYEVGEEVREAFLARDSAAATAFVPTRPGHWRVDLYALARQRLIRAGLVPEAIHGGQHCTIRERDRFFSHRRDGQSGRMATLVWIHPAS